MLPDDIFELLANQPKDDDADKDLLTAVRKAVWALPEKSKEIIVLRYYDKLSYEQIRDIYGLSNQAINGRIFRAKKKIASYLKKEGYINE